MSFSARRLAFGLVVCAALGAQEPPPGATPWPVKTRPHIDLWLHGYALLTEDTTRVPLFARDYTGTQQAGKNARTLLTKFDAQRDKLARGLQAMPTIAAAQFLPLQYPTAAEFERAMLAFQLADGDPRRARTRDDQEAILALGGIFKTAAHRAWLKEFREALRDDDEKWFRSWWSDEQKARLAALTAFDRRWQSELRPAMQRWLNASNAADGEIILSPVLEAEGRTVTISKRRNTVVIGWPRDTTRADEAFFAFCHEIVGSVSAAAIADNLTPAQQRDGIGERLQASGLVRGGLELVRAVAPSKVDAYARFYLRAAGLPMAGDAVASLEANFALPDVIVAAIKANIAAGFGGI